MSHYKFDGVDSIGDRWYLCIKHKQRFCNFCPGCHPRLDKIIKIISLFTASIVVLILFGPVIYLLLDQIIQ